MTPFATAVVFGALPAARLTPPIASSAMNAPTAAVAPFSTVRRVAAPSVAGVAPLLAIGPHIPPLHSPPRDDHPFDDHPGRGQPNQREHVRADALRDRPGLLWTR